MQERIPLLYNGVQVGNITAAWKNNRLHLSAVCFTVLDGIYRIYAVSNSGERLLIGVALPEGEMMHAERVYSRNAISALSFECEGMTHGVLAASLDTGDNLGIWEVCNTPQEFFSDQAIRNALKNAEGALTCKTDKDTLIAVPYDPSLPFLLTPAFSIVRICEIGSGRYAVINAM